MHALGRIAPRGDLEFIVSSEELDNFRHLSDLLLRCSFNSSALSCD